MPLLCRLLSIPYASPEADHGHKGIWTKLAREKKTEGRNCDLGLLRLCLVSHVDSGVTFTLSHGTAQLSLTPPIYLHSMHSVWTLGVCLFLKLEILRVHKIYCCINSNNAVFHLKTAHGLCSHQEPSSLVEWSKRWILTPQSKQLSKEHSVGLTAIYFYSQACSCCALILSPNTFQSSLTIQSLLNPSG